MEPGVVAAGAAAAALYVYLKQKHWGGGVAGDLGADGAAGGGGGSGVGGGATISINNSTVAAASPPRSMEACRTAHTAGAVFLWEHPEDLGVTSKGGNPASVWALEEMFALAASTQGATKRPSFIMPFYNPAFHPFSSNFPAKFSKNARAAKMPTKCRKNAYKCRKRAESMPR